MAASILPVEEPAPRQKLIFAGEIYQVVEGTPEGEIRDQIAARLEQLAALLDIIHGEGSEVFFRYNDRIKDEVLSLAHSLAVECRDLHEIIDSPPWHPFTERAAPRQKLEFAGKIYEVVEGAHGGEICDQIDARLEQLAALLEVIHGEGSEVFFRYNDRIKDEVLSLAYSLDVECRDLLAVRDAR